MIGSLINLIICHSSVPIPEKNIRRSIYVLKGTPGEGQMQMNCALQVYQPLYESICRFAHMSHLICTYGFKIYEHMQNRYILNMICNLDKPAGLRYSIWQTQQKSLQILRQQCCLLQSTCIHIHRFVYWFWHIWLGEARYAGRHSRKIPFAKNRLTTKNDVGDGTCLDTNKVWSMN